MYPLTRHRKVSTALRATRLIAAAMVTAGAALAASTPAAAAASASNIEVTHAPAKASASTADAGHCLPGLLALSHRVTDTATSFALRITANTKLCDPVEATAVIYAMPGDGVAWPQTRLERRKLVLSEAGTYTVRFTKTCQPAQFDVVVGATPSTIAPWAERHGPLLFPFDTSTALQHWGWECTPSTPPTTVVSTTTTVAPPATTTTTPGGGTPTTVAAPVTTTTVAEPTSTTTTVAQGAPTTVTEPAVTVAAGDPTAPDGEHPVTEVTVRAVREPHPERLADTGGELSVAGTGWALVAAGCVALALRHRRTD